MMQVMDEHDLYFVEASSVKKKSSFTLGQLFYLPFKRIFDFTISAILLIALSPLFLIISILISLEKDGTVFFRQKRVGKNGRIITIYKFRTMSSKAPSEIATAEFTDSDIYITKLGKFLRKMSIDELPQFFNVLKGDMSIIGPRPLILNETSTHSIRIKKGIYAIKPGLTGLAQINGRDLLTSLEKVRYDEYYLHHFNLLIDFKILLRSLIIVLTHKGFIEGHQQTKIYIYPKTEVSAESQSKVAYIHNSEEPLSEDEIKRHQMLM